jgi:hypothetical protein
VHTDPRCAAGEACRKGGLGTPLVALDPPSASTPSERKMALGAIGPGTASCTEWTGAPRDPHRVARAAPGTRIPDPTASHGGFGCSHLCRQAASGRQKDVAVAASATLDQLGRHVGPPQLMQRCGSIWPRGGLAQRRSVRGLRVRDLQPHAATVPVPARSARLSRRAARACPTPRQRGRWLPPRPQSPRLEHGEAVLA